jgi:hypothetical protein
MDGSGALESTNAEASDCDPIDRDETIRRWVAALDEDALRREYQETDGLLVMPTLLPPSLVAEMIAEARALSPRVVRKLAPFVRRAGAIHHHVIVEHAPAMHALHQSPELLALFERVTGIPLEHRAPTEAHASALYAYRGGDYLAFHYDECGCEPGDSFSTVIGLVDQSSARLEIETRKDQQGREPMRRSLQTSAGTFAFFCGTRAYHRVTKLAPGEERITFAFTYVRKGKKPTGMYNFRMQLGNTFVYFGLGHLFHRS